jgi:hypothetical protein
VCGRAAARQLDGAHTGHRSPHGAPPARGCLVQVAGREARHPCPALGEEGSAPRQAGASPPRARRAAPTAGRRWRGAGSGSELLDAVATQVAFLRGVMLLPGPCPPSRRGPRDGNGCAEVVDVGHHWVVQEAGLSMGVHRGVRLHELPPSQRCRMDLPGPTTSVGARTDYLVGPGTTRLALHGTCWPEAQGLRRRSTRIGSCTCSALYRGLLDVLD